MKNLPIEGGFFPIYMKRLLDFELKTDGWIQCQAEDEKQSASRHKARLVRTILLALCPEDCFLAELLTKRVLGEAGLKLCIYLVDNFLQVNLIHPCPFS